MSQLTMARPYATAVFELAQSEKALPLWSEMLGLAADITRDPAFIEAIKDPRFSKHLLADIMCDVGGKQFSPSMQQFIATLANFRRLGLLAEVHFLYEALRAKAEERVHVVITSAQPLDKAFQQQFIEALKKRLHRDVDLECVTDHNILGGAIIRANDLVIDGSVRGRLAKMGDAMGIIA